VARTNFSNSAFVTSVASIQKPSTYTRCIGSVSATVAGEQQDLPSHFPSLPMENSPPGIHTMPSGAGLGGFEELAIVGAKDEVSFAAGRSGVNRVRAQGQCKHRDCGEREESG
jgi:hypothetical protein